MQHVTDNPKIDKIKQELAEVPTSPGVYLWKNNKGEVIYVGKAKNLRARMRQYVNLQDERAKIPLLVNEIDTFDYVVTVNEHESLLLEMNLINQYHPYFNVDFKDNKSYPFLAITKRDVFPAIKYTREKHNPDTKYFGPYTDSRAARELLNISRKIVPICSASCAEWRKMTRKLRQRFDGRSDVTAEEVREVLGDNPSPCFDAHVGIGPGACCNRIDPEQYAKNVSRIERFLAGDRSAFTSELRTEMEQAAGALEFEKAARLKSRIDTVNSITNKQYAVSGDTENADIIGFHREEDIAGAHVLVVREGRIINSNEFILDKGQDIPDLDFQHNFLIKYYSTTTSIPSNVVLRDEPEDKEVMQNWLTGLLDSTHGAKVKIVSPKKGVKAHLMEMAETNAKHSLLRYKVRTSYDDKRINSALAQLESALALDGPPMRIESFDISTLHGSHTVASMVVFTAGKPDKNQYRRFKVRAELDEANDFLSMQEIIKRRYSKERMSDERFASRPDLIILDGGKPQLTAALKVFEELGIDDIPIVGLAKRDEEIFVPWQDSGPVVLPSGSASLYLVKQIRDEAHRFAITFHRQLRGKGMTASILDEVVGIGPVRKKALLRHFKSMRNLRNATLEDIEQSKILPEEVARELYAVLQQYNQDTKPKSNQDAKPEIEELEKEA